MVKEITIGKMKKAYLIEEDIVEIEEYFQQAVIISTQKNEIFNETTFSNSDNTTSISITPTNPYDSDKKFDQYLLEAIDETFSSLGEVVKNAVFEHLQNDFQIKRVDIPIEICEFSKVIHKVFGLGAGRLELKIMNSLNSKLQVDVKLTEYQWPLSKWIVNEVSLTDYVQNLRNSYAETVRKRTY
jgi:hypothetical protein